jgi:uncharacterized OB-fold protein
MTSLDEFLVAGEAVLATAVPGPYLVESREQGHHGILRLQRCDECSYLRYPPAGRCPECLSREWTWVDDSGAGSIWSFAVYHRAFTKPFADLLPYNVALVELDSGPRLITNVLDVEPDQLHVGARGVAAPVGLPGGGSLIYFTLAQEGTS